MSGYVYAIGLEGTSLVKIGVAKDVAKRLARLQTGLPYKLVVLHQEQVEEPRRVEWALHDILEAVRERGEWFELPEVYFPSLFAQGIAHSEKEPEPEATSEAFEDTLGRRIVSARMQRGVKQAELARALGISSNAMVDIEKGRTSPRAKHVRAIAQALRVSADYLLGLTDEEQNGRWEKAPPRRRQGAATADS